MFTIADKYKAFIAAVTGLAEVLIAAYVEDPALLVAIAAVLGTGFVYRVPNEKKPTLRNLERGAITLMTVVLVLAAILIVVLLIAYVNVDVKGG